MVLPRAWSAFRHYGSLGNAWHVVRMSPRAAFDPSISPSGNHFWLLCVVAQPIPIALLELNTFGHAVCALIIYMIWWEKPFEVDYPTMIFSQDLWDVCALKSMIEGKSAISEVWDSLFTMEMEDYEYTKNYESQYTSINQCHHAPLSIGYLRRPFAKR